MRRNKVVTGSTEQMVHAEMLALIAACLRAENPADQLKKAAVAMGHVPTVRSARSEHYEGDGGD